MIMPNTTTAVAFKGTAEQEERLRAAIERFKGQPGAAMPVLQEAQAIYGYLPEEALLIVSEGLGKTLSELYGIVSFYAQFSVNPKGEHQISVCLGTACYVKGAANILERVERKLGCKAGAVTPDGKFSIDATRCIGACGLAPVMTVDSDVYGRLSPDDVDGILDKYHGASL
jgi:NADH-quinone oxidoreductase subunit E/NADP-reducing hydrogenase subunit HndA